MVLWPLSDIVESEHVYDCSTFLTSHFSLIYFAGDIRIGRMAYVKVMLMDHSCMRTGTKICNSLVMGKMGDNNYFRYLLLKSCGWAFFLILRHNICFYHWESFCSCSCLYCVPKPS